MKKQLKRVRLARKRRKSSSDDWIEDLLKLGLGVLAISFLAKLSEGSPQIKVCPYCNNQIKKFARTCPVCRNVLSL